MKKLILAILLVVFAGVSLPAVSFAAEAPGSLFIACDQAGADNSAACVGHSNQTSNPISGPSSLIIKITNVIAYVAGIAAVILLIIAGIKYITSQGDSAGVKAAKASLINVFIGIVIIVLGRQFIVYIVSRI